MDLSKKQPGWKALSSLENVGLLTEVTGRKRDKAYAAMEALKVLDGE